MRPLIDLAYRLRRGVLGALRWRTRGVKVMVFDRAGRLLLVRHRYGRTDLWMLPGGGIAHGEAPVAAAVREVAEEVGCGLCDVAPVSVHLSRAEGRRDTVHLFRATTDDAATADGVEIAEAQFFALDDLPAAVSDATRRRIDELRGRRVADETW